MNIIDRSKTKCMIHVTFQKEGIHFYSAAATSPTLADVSFLGTPHRHIFWFKVGIEVQHGDRDIEFIQFKRWLESKYDSNQNEGVLQLNYRSCEMIADELALEINRRYPGRDIQITVEEDGENGSTTYYDKFAFEQQ